MNEPFQPRSFGHGKPAAQAAAQVAEAETLDFASLRGELPAPEHPAWMTPILLATFLGILLGAIYFIHATLAFKNAVLLNVTDIFGPYPDFAVIFVMLPAFCGPFYVLIDFLRLKTGISPRSPQGIGGILLLFLVLGALALLPVHVIRHNTNGFATAHGYTKCSSPFDPAHTKVYALKSYVDTYGCPTYTVPQ